ncbi:MAG: hypothetical protein A3C90_02020 [Candidatus Magasanikbacteria bacterium RIFCSPHIGHO2_02_FULL_51_14]|uniref:Glycosyl transferase family 1 domain-containing protein n=1 Tax=Candidatus Magasanikbacteria bacterium RIFCSPHIGHO2_02_FULL_51_14 TaxID=1798683 RepID=A0A1F6MDZ4_9BACT|nr:MAG: hypothetical protein A3C90_02020 [Candidatus Magasanikbacteria bacterium RIFCSPHIGHO2_02_FULL_51_14]
MAALKELKNADWTLDIIGEGVEKETIQKKIRDYQLDRRVHLLPPTLDVPEIMALHDIMLMPSRWEGLGIAAMEAMAAGRVVIASRVGGLPEVITHEKNGFLVPPEDPQALALRITYCFEHPDHCKEIAAQARKDARRFDVKNMVREYEQVYRALAKR